MTEPCFSAFMLSCDERREARRSSLESLEMSGWRDPPEIVLDDGIGATRIERIHRTWRRVVQRAASATTEFTLLLEDDLVFGACFAKNLASWPLLKEIQPGGALFASLYNPGRPFIVRRESERYLVA